MNSFNAFGTRSASFGASVPVWLGTVTPIPVGGTLVSAFVFGGLKISAGAPIYYDAANKTIRPFCAWEIVSKDTSTHTIVVKANEYGILPKANDVLAVLGASFAASTSAAVVSAIAPTSDEGQYEITFATAGNDTAATVGGFLTYSSDSTAGTSGKSVAYQPNGYLYNDIYIEPIAAGVEVENLAATGAVVQFHAEGVLIDRTPSYPFKEMMKVAVPNVLQVNG